MLIWKLVAIIIILRSIELRLSFTVAIHIIHASPAMKRLVALHQKYGLKRDSMKKPYYVVPVEVNLAFKNIFHAIPHALHAKVHLIQAVTYISICILRHDHLEGIRSLEVSFTV